MSTEEMKAVLFQKLQDEETGFKKSDISIRKTKYGYKITIKEYEHCPFEMKLEEDDMFGFIVAVKDTLYDEQIIFRTSKHEYLIREALINLGYYIGTRF